MRYMIAHDRFLSTSGPTLTDADNHLRSHGRHSRPMLTMTSQWPPFSSHFRPCRPLVAISSHFWPFLATRSPLEAIGYHFWPFSTQWTISGPFPAPVDHWQAELPLRGHSEATQATVDQRPWKLGLGQGAHPLGWPWPTCL